MGDDRPVLAAQSISRRFGSVVALEEASLELHAGAVLCLLGDNGAGKSTVIKILSGVFPPTAGHLELDGERLALASPRVARERGIATVYQDLAMVPLMSVWRNFFLGAEPTRGRGPLRRLDVAHCERIVREELARLAITVRDPAQPVGTLSGGERQALAIARAVHFGARVLILDEPTAALGVRQAGIVLEEIGRARDRGVAVLLVTHNPEHAVAVGDRFIVLRHGRVAGGFSRGEVDAVGLAGVMAG